MLIYRLHENPQLVYNTLTERDAFVMLESHHRFGRELDNVLTVRGPSLTLSECTHRCPVGSLLPAKGEGHRASELKLALLAGPSQLRSQRVDSPIPCTS